jgi:hypothetical protein
LNKGIPDAIAGGSGFYFPFDEYIKFYSWADVLIRANEIYDRLQKR